MLTDFRAAGLLAPRADKRPDSQRKFIDEVYAEIHRKWRDMRADNIRMMQEFNELRTKRTTAPAAAR